MVKRLLVALGLLSGCAPKQAVQAVPTEPGTSLPLAYPVVLVGEHTVTVRDDMQTLVSASLSSGISFKARRIIDSTGAIFEVKRETVVGDTKPWWSDMGTSQQSHYLELVKARDSGLAAARKLVLDEVRSPQSVWEGNPQAVARVESFSTISEFIAGCSESWKWSR